MIYIISILNNKNIKVLFLSYRILYYKINLNIKKELFYILLIYYNT